VGKPFTAEDVRARQPDTENHHDPQNLDPTIFPPQRRHLHQPSAAVVPAVLTNGTCYELELCKVSDFRSILNVCIRINKVCRGTANCASVPMDHDLWIYFVDFAAAFHKHKEAPPDVRCNVKNLVGTAMKEDKFGKSRFELLCHGIDDNPSQNTLDADLVPFKIRAIQVHSARQEGCMALYAPAVQMSCSFKFQS
jgi:hypothetical protein